MAKKIALAIVALLVLLAAGGYVLLRSLVSDETVRAQLSSRLTAALGQPVVIDRAHLVFSPKIGLELGGVRVGAPARVRLERVRLVTGLRALLNRRVEGAEVVVDGGDVELPLPPMTLGGSAPAGAAPAAPADRGSGRGLAVVSVDTIAFRNVRVASGGRVVAVDLDTSLSADRLDVKRLAATADGLQIEGTGAVMNLGDPHAVFDLTASELDLDQIMAILAAFTPAVPDGASPAPAPAPKRPAAAGATPAIAVSLTAPKGRVAGVAFTDLTAKAAVDGGRVSLDPLSFGVFGGRYAGSLVVDTAGAVPVFTWAATLDGVDVAAALAAAGADAAMTGRLSARVRLTGAGADAAAALGSLNGTGRVDVKNGTLPHLELVGAVVRAVGRPGEAPTGSGEAFSTLGGSFSLANGVLTSTDLMMDSRDLDVDGAGTVSLAAASMDVRANLRLSEDLSKRVGRDAARLTGERTRMTFPVVVTGPVAQPGVTVDARGLVQKAATEELRKQLEKGIGNLLKKKKPGGGRRS